MEVVRVLCIRRRVRKHAVGTTESGCSHGERYGGYDRRSFQEW